MAPEIFPESTKLIEIIERHDWQLYEVDNGKTFKLNELQEKGPSQQFTIGNQYIFVPKLKEGQSVRDAYSVTKGLGPAMVIPSIDDHVDMDGAGALPIRGDLMYIFTRMIFEPDSLYITSPKIPLLMPHPPVLRILYRSVIDKFSKHFRIVTPEEMSVSREEIAKPEPPTFRQNSEDN